MIALELGGWRLQRTGIDIGCRKKIINAIKNSLY